MRSERSASSAAISSATAASDGGRPRASRRASAAAASSRRPSSKSRRAAISRACSALARSARASSVAAAAASERGEPPRSRMASATSASATTHRARASSSWAPKPRAARRRSSRARGCSPSWAMAMPRRASAGGSSRRATRLSAPSASPAARARAAAAIRESMTTRYSAAPISRRACCFLCSAAPKTPSSAHDVLADRSRSDVSTGQFSQTFDIPHRRFAKVPLVFRAEVRGVIVTDAVGSLVMAHGDRTWSRAHGRAGTSRREIGFCRAASSSANSVLFFHPMIATAAVGVHTISHLFIAGLVAWIVYDFIGLAVLRRSWINLDLIWSFSLLAAALILFFAPLA